MPKYFFKISATYVAKNKLYSEFCDFAIAHDRTLLLSKEEMNSFKKKFRDKLVELQEKHKRCKDIRFEVDRGYAAENVDWSFRDNGCWRAEAYLIKEELCTQ